jgi:hypothetical protein
VDETRGLRRLHVGALFLALGMPLSVAAQTSDFSVAWIARLPKIDYVPGSSDPAVEGWPAAGFVVTWVAHVRSSRATAANAGYRWTIDGQTAGEGIVALAPRAYTQVELPWTWTFDRHVIAFEIDTGNAFAETQERNNVLTIASNALSVAFYAERSYWNGSEPRVRTLDVGAATLDDWLQRRIRIFNEMAELARYPETPQGVIDRLRIDAIHVVDDGALPLSPYPEVASNYPASARPIRFPNAADRSVDLQWGFTFADYPLPGVPDDLYDSLMHELGHARYLVDVYAWGVAEWRGDRVAIDPPPPMRSRSWYDTRHWGLMNQHYGFIDRYSAAALNLIAGHRPTSGNFNPPENLGRFLNDLPERNRVRLADPSGVPFANATVRIYQSSAEYYAQGVYPKTYDDVPDLEVTSDADGWIELPRNPFSSGPVVHGEEWGFGPGSNVTAIVEVESGGAVSWGFLESLDFNLAWWRGEREVAEHEVVVGAPLCSSATFPFLTTPLPEGRVTSRNVTFGWDGVTTPLRWELWLAVNGGTPRKLLERPGSERFVTAGVPPGRIAWWITATYDERCPAARSSTYFFDHDVGPAHRRAAGR